MKPLHQSKTIWVNGLVLVAAICVEVLPVLRDHLPQHSGVIAASLAVVNIVLRHLTSQPLGHERDIPPVT